MEKAQKAVDAVVDGVKNVAIGSEKKPKAKKEKGGDGGAEGPLGRRTWKCITLQCANKLQK
jgi:threonyl-tRNA synthetase